MRFGDRIESCEAAILTRRLALADAVRLGHWSLALELTLKAQSAAIRSLNDAWGVFSRSRIDLLPHQLWVCHRALQHWPIRLLIADDVGLGKTIEAGLILWPLLSSGRVRRLLILTPAALVEQWQYRLRTLFDIRLSLYRSEVDTPKADFWSTHHQVVASLPTLRADRKGRHERLLDAPRWDMLIVDEAHHLNADEATGKTLGFKFVERLVAEERVESCLFFTGTPHRGKPFGFWSLMSLPRPDDFSLHRLEPEQLPRLREILIRNFKQKIASSSVAAICSALRKRLANLEQQVATFREEQVNSEGSEDDADADVFAAFDQWTRQARFQLMEDELPHLKALLDAAGPIVDESKMLRIGELIDTRYTGRSVLLFTE
ncbi:DEAD/DEAH box helicase [Thiocystis violascens]|uniref:DNA/RNA helicase, superfamily II, SNF2 family n=1 Tax=Thiocystis violascens (strain ATCC 17096 / DSM 198 / 6111) TaxID=765911 RepID=I3YH94_THIV6|nr:DEAD/DEAH box helicase [Thiocystis violascens]AFL76362.1 DNA/RNA helicase, superfamily II, SNF2 family [Thiocystis violascens DSM 198]